MSDDQNTPLQARHVNSQDDYDYNNRQIERIDKELRAKAEAEGWYDSKLHENIIKEILPFRRMNYDSTNPVLAGIYLRETTSQPLDRNDPRYAALYKALDEAMAGLNSQHQTAIAAQNIIIKPISNIGEALPGNIIIDRAFFDKYHNNPQLLNALLVHELKHQYQFLDDEAIIHIYYVRLEEEALASNDPALVTRYREAIKFIQGDESRADLAAALYADPKGALGMLKAVKEISDARSDQELRDIFIAIIALDLIMQDNPGITIQDITNRALALTEAQREKYRDEAENIYKKQGGKIKEYIEAIEGKYTAGIEESAAAPATPLDEHPDTNSRIERVKDFKNLDKDAAALFGHVDEDKKRDLLKNIQEIAAPLKGMAILGDARDAAEILSDGKFEKADIKVVLQYLLEHPEVLGDTKLAQLDGDGGNVSIDDLRLAVGKINASQNQQPAAGRQ